MKKSNLIIVSRKRMRAERETNLRPNKKGSLWFKDEFIKLFISGYDGDFGIADMSSKAGLRKK